MFKKSLKKLQKQFKGKSRSEIIDAKIQDISKDLVTLGFTNEELALIASHLSKDIKNLLQHRKELLTKELEQTIKAINKL
jgi:hypothetical protein